MHAVERKLSNGWVEYELENDHGMRFRFLNFGGIVIEIVVPDKEGIRENVVLGLEDVEEYKENKAYFGALIGPVAGRVKGATFQKGRDVYRFQANDGEHLLHSGSEGFHKQLFDVTLFEHEDRVGAQLSLKSQQKSLFPGDISPLITYIVTNENEWIIDYHATVSEMTPLAMTNHTYFNLAGSGNESIHTHIMKMKSDCYLELDHALIPTGHICSVEEQPAFDFRKGKRIGEGLAALHRQLKIAGGYDHFFLLNENRSEAVSVWDQRSGRVMKMTTTQPGVVFYTGNGLDGRLALNNRKTAIKHGGFCLETQGHPAALHVKGFPSIWVKPDEHYNHQTRYQFTTE
ncbi:aldose epimerase family protein [Shouchella sp. JSM 1781072]|uniref:aldose epimerase family protein n=1 Tax=Bacillaceae TaxID=186817 RepID=UPI000C06FC13|nr:aldose epimerase family protein [Bacillus sp. Marseille-P3800]